MNIPPPLGPLGNIQLGDKVRGREKEREGIRERKREEKGKARGKA